ncbi:beta-lactamase/transpeptidase-like protein [Trichoderma compactum]
MGRRLRLCLAAAVAIAGSRVNAAGYVREQKPITGQGSPASGNPLTAEFGDFVREQLEKWKVPGVSLAVIDGDDVYTEGYGHATLPDVPATPETLWYGASTSKAQVAAVLSALIHSSNYSAFSQGWATPISSIIRDDFVLQDDWATNHITLDDAVSHRTGMPRHDVSSVKEIDGRPATPRDIVRNLRNLPLAAEPRVTVYYCNLMYVTLSYVIETVTGKWLGDVLRELLWEPLGMRSTYFDLQSALDAPQHMASGYAWNLDKEEYEEIPFMTLTEVSGAGSVISNVADYAKWVKSLIHQSGPLSGDVHKDIRAPRVFWPGEPGNGLDLQLYGLGWVRTLHKGHVLYTHSGGMHAYGAEVYWFPEVKYGVVALGNTAKCHVVEEIVGWKLIEDKLGIPEKDRPDFGAKWKKAEEKLDWLYDNALDILYPDRPNPGLPSTLSTSELLGTYYNVGYGNITLREEPHPDKLGEKILAADRPDSTWNYSMRFHHVSGDHWIVYLPAPIYNGRKYVDFMAAEFKVGADGKPSAIEIVWESRTDPMPEGTAEYKRIA